MNSVREECKVLGLLWDKETDSFRFSVKLDFPAQSNNIVHDPNINILCKVSSGEPVMLTKCIILSLINGIYDPIGFLGPIIVRAKILMKQLWNKGELDWDDEVPTTLKMDWIQFFHDLTTVRDITFKRCFKPQNHIGNPVMITFCDASENAFGACTYLRWEDSDHRYHSRLIGSKIRIAPSKVLTIVRLEVCGAVLAKRLAKFIENETELIMQRKYFITDSEVARSMIQKESYGFNTFIDVRIGEIQETDPTSWYWVDGDLNIADWLTRGNKKPSDLGANSIWQQGPQFLQLPENQWPIRRTIVTGELPEQKKIVKVHLTKIIGNDVIDINRFSKYFKLLRVTARVMSVFKGKPSLKNLMKAPTKEMLENAEVLWIKDAQYMILDKIQKGGFQRLCPKQRSDGIYVVSGRAERWHTNNYNEEGLILLPSEHKIAKLYAEYVHNRCHLGVLATVSKVRSRF